MKTLKESTLVSYFLVFCTLTIEGVCGWGWGQSNKKYLVGIQLTQIDLPPIHLQFWIENSQIGAEVQKLNAHFSYRC